MDLERAYITSGKGRPPSPPSVRCTKKLLLQLYCLKEKNNRTWGEVESWCKKQFKDFDYPAKKYRHLIESTRTKLLNHVDCGHLGCSQHKGAETEWNNNANCSLVLNELHNPVKCDISDCRKVIYNTEVDLNYIGPACQQLGLNRSNIHDSTPPTEIDVLCSEKVTNGLILELLKFCEDEAAGPTYSYLYKLLCIFVPDFKVQFSGVPALKKHILAVVKRYKTLCKKFKTMGYYCILSRLMFLCVPNVSA